MKKFYLPVILGLAHGVNDCSAGMLLGNLSGSGSIYGAGMLVFVYNILAFGAQPIAGIAADKLKSPKLASVVGLVLMAGALILPGINPMISIIMAGAGSALFHVGGGALAICVTDGKASGPGLFSAPGVAGLAIGGYISLSGGFYVLPLIGLLLVLSIIISLAHMPVMPYTKPDNRIEFEKHDYIMLIILFAIALRSAVWNIFQYIGHGEAVNIVLIGMAAMSGKVFGGFAADRIGWRNYSVGALVAAIPFLIAGEANIYLFLPGIALLQSVTPVLISAVARGMPRMPATASGLTLGFAIAVGGLPFVSGMDIEKINSPPLIAVSVVLVSIILFIAMKPKTIILGK